MNYRRAFETIFISVSVILLIIYTFPQLISAPASMFTSSQQDKEAVEDADAARELLSQKRAEGETGFVQVSGCVQEPDNWEMARHDKIPNTIFVSVASYRDDECKDTVYDMFAKAKNPDNIFVGVCQQNKEGEEDCFDKCPECSQRKMSGNIRVINFDYMDARGPTFARYQCSKLWRGEEFYFQIDSHLKFEQNWDETLIGQMRATGDENAVVGAYPPTDEQMKEMIANGFTTMITMCPNKFDTNGLPTISAQVVSTKGREKPLPIGLQPAGMMCFPGKALYDVPYDPYLNYLFFGEEFLFSARLFTAGYNMYSPVKNFAVHHYGREGKPKYHQDHKESEACKKKAIQRVKYILGMIDKRAVHPDYFIDIDKYGLGKKRSLREYEKFVGVNLKTKTVNKSCPYP